MENFKVYFESKIAEEDKNIKMTLGKLPNLHKSLIKGYKYEFQLGNTLDRDNKHIGYVDRSEKKIVIAAPWCFGREFTFLHEIAHRVWEKILDENLKNKWKNIIQTTKGDIKESAEELFCMAYANYYSKNKLVNFDKKQWSNFIKGLPQ